MYLRNGLKISLNNSITKDGITYPSPINQHWFPILGISEVPDPEKPNPETHTYSENPDGSLNHIERPLSTVKTVRLRKLRDEARALFDSAYDLLDITIILSGQAAAGPTNKLKADILALVSAYQTAKTSINAATTIAEVLAVEVTWPTL